ncbi:serine/threonine-protein kinase [Polyangium fumosum]|uniref:Serine/threonine protein kinase n=1 Tax=Polyangium fumosum TaxID=889272 RepID=A0A4V5PJN5_9BACT|nr:serine/threonine-protein kinase [Polyangium fumosum]TKC92110.1 serine/threonine protein kinase [Polyangium fumosum]
MGNEAVQSQVAVGEILAGKYRVERTLGMGGMGVVVAVTHLELRDERAIKLVRADLTHPQIIERFLREARVVVKLRSEHVAQVYDIGRLPTGAPFMVMELLHGDDLSALLKKRGTLPVHEAVLYVMQACDALAEAHGRGIVHRDLKPANLFLTHREDGSPCIKVLDFGVSKHVPEEGESAELEMTSNGDIMGSPLYMAPEQMRAAREVDARADIWALGAILYKLVTGRAPFQRATTPEICMAVLGSEMAPLPSSLQGGIPSGLEAVIMRCLCKDVDSRFPRALDLKAALSPYSERREGWPEDERVSLVDDPRSSTRGSNSSRPIPKNIDAILLGCIGKDTGRRAARAKGRRNVSDPFLKKRAEAAEPKALAATPAEPPVDMPRDPEFSCAGGGTVPMGSTDLRKAREMNCGRPPQGSQPTEPAPPPDPAGVLGAMNLEETIDEATALAPPRLPSFPAPPPPSVRTSLPSFRVPSAGEPLGNSMAPWDYAPAASAPRGAKPVAFLASATTAVFIVIALVMAFTTGGEKNIAEGAVRGADMRPAAGGMPAPAEPAIALEPEVDASATADETDETP